VTSLVEFLGAAPAGDGTWTFALDGELHGAFGGAFGGVVAAAALHAARSVAPDRVPVALDVRFLRSLPAGTATATASILHAGRTLSCVSVDLGQQDGRLAARATISLVNGEALAQVSKEDDARPALPSYDDGRPWPPVGAPIIETLAPRTVPWPGAGEAVAMRVPWDVGDDWAEAVCLPADMCVGPPVVFGLAGEGLAHPNPDLSLRFAAPSRSRELIGVGRLERVHAGLATVAVEVWDSDRLVAVGISTSTLLARSSG
jgi:acyl-coenzyme A thioesterase PaaI-like protein